MNARPITHAKAARSQNLPHWVADALSTAARVVNSDAPIQSNGRALRLGIDLGTSDIVALVVDERNTVVAACLEWADVVRDGVVLDFYGATQIIKRHLAHLNQVLGVSFESATTSFPPGTDPRISVNVLQAAGLEVSAVIDEPSAVAHLLDLDKAAVVDIGGGTTGIAVVQKGQVVYSGDEPSGGRHVSLTIAGGEKITLEAAEQLKIAKGKQVWPMVRPVFEKMADIVRAHIQGHEVRTLYMSGGSCSLAGVGELFADEFPELEIVLPKHPIFLTPFAIAAYQTHATNAGAQQ